MPFLDWINKNQAIDATKGVPYHLLKQEKSFGDDSENMIIQGDNLLALKALLPFYAGQVKCIYIDPPYNTQNDFGHYDDKLEHSWWLSTMYPRVSLIRDLLSENGSLWISIDDDEAHYLKVMCDEIFGRRNFISNVIWQKKSSPSNDAKWISDNHDHILVYAKDKSIWRPNKLERSDAQNAIYKNSDEFDGIDEKGNHYGRGPWFAGDMTVKTVSESALYDIETPSGRVVKPADGRAWVYSRQKFEELLAENRITFGKGGSNKPCIKRFLVEVEESKIVPKSVWLYEEVGENRNARQEVKKFNQSDPFSTPKPEKLLERILRLSTDKDDLVLDSFLGSGTTAAVAHKMGLRYIGIEMGSHAVTHCIPRLEKVIGGEQGGISDLVNWQGGGGFNLYKLGAPIFNADGSINSEVKFQTLASFIWRIETNQAGNRNFDSPFLGIHNGVGYYLLYNGILGDRRPESGNVLTGAVLKAINEILPHDGPKVIYGESARLGQGRLSAAGITFKQIPYDINVL